MANRVWTQVVFFLGMFCLSHIAFSAVVEIEKSVPQKETLILHDTATNKYFYLAERISREDKKEVPFRRPFWHPLFKFKWIETTESIIRDQLAGPPGHYLFPNGELRMNPERTSVEFRANPNGIWIKAQRELDDGTLYQKAWIDKKGNIHTRLDGPLISQHFATYQVTPNDQLGKPDNAIRGKLEADVSDNIETFVANPYGKGFYIRYENGAILKATPSTGLLSSNFLSYKTTHVVQEGASTGLVHAHGKLFVLQDGRIALLDSMSLLRYFELPEGVNASEHLRIYSSYDFKRNEVKYGEWKTKRAQISTKLETEPKKDLATFFRELETAKATLRERVIDQHRYTDALVELWRDTFLGSDPKDQHKTLLVTGPTGSGKTFGALEFAKLVLDDPKRLLEIDATHFSGTETSMDVGKLIGFPPGTRDQDKFKGILPEFLRGPGKGKNVIVINEFDKASKLFSRTIMEMIDTGKLQAGDGKIDELGQSIIVFTSNKGADKIYPRDRKNGLTWTEREARLDRFNDAAVKSLFLQPDATNLYDHSKVLDPAFLSRIDRAIPVGPPSYEGALKIAQRKAESLKLSFKEKFGVTIELAPSTIRHLVDTFFVPEDGSRAVEKSIKRAFGDTLSLLQTHSETKITDAAGLRPLTASFITEARLEFERDDESGISPKIVVHTEPASDTELQLPPYERKDDIFIRFSNPEVRAKTRAYEESLEKHVFGQPEAVKMAARAIRVRELNPSMIQPAAALFLGPTGVGKTELAKAIASVVYGDFDRIVPFDMGAVKEHSDFRNIFSPPKGYVGSDTLSPFEQALSDFPEGCVILFDEIGNMGGDAFTKRQLLMIFYRMLEEGKWQSPQGKTYDLSKFYFVFTSNEGQEIMQGLPSDDLRMAQWNAYNKKSILSELLISKHHWPEAFVGRFKGNITLFKPILASERKAMAEKLVKKSLGELFKVHKLKEFTVSDTFYQTLGDTFFLHSKGGRSIRDVVDQGLSDLVGLAIFEAYELAGSPLKAKLLLDLNDSYAGKFMYVGEKPPVRRVILTAKIILPSGESKDFQIDLAKEAAEKQLSSIQTLRRTVFHETGHAIANDSKLTGEIIDHITVKSAGNYGGYARYVERNSAPLTREAAVARIGRMLAGRAGELYMGFEFSQGWQSDLEKARQLAQDAIIKYGLVEDPFSMPALGEKPDPNHPRIHKEISKILHEGNAYAKQRIESNKTLFRLVAAQLLKNKEMNGAQFKALEERVRCEGLLQL